MTEGPDTVVREAEARDSVESLTEGMANAARAAGAIPPMRAIEDFAQKVTHETIARHEERMRSLVEAPPPVAGPSAAKLDSLATDESTRVIHRPLDLDRLAQKRGRWVPLHEAMETALVRARVEHLMSYEKRADGHARRFPEWVARLQRTYSETKALAANLALDDMEQQKVAADAVMKLLDESDATFARDLGPWRHPKNPPQVIAAMAAQES